MSSRWILAHRSNVLPSCIIGAKFHSSYAAFYVVIEVLQFTVLCNEVERIYGDSEELVYAPLSVAQSIREGQTNFSFHFRFHCDGFLRSGRDLLYVESSTSFVEQRPASLEPIFCALCGVDNFGCQRSGPLAFIGKDENVNHEELWAHAFCYSLSPKLPQETAVAFLRRCQHNFCNVCNSRNASLYCDNKKCQKKFHLRCAVQSGEAEYIDGLGKCVCAKHLPDLCLQNQQLIRFPQDSAIYGRVCDWSMIKPEHIARIVAFSRFYQPFNVLWFHGCFQNCVEVSEIYAGHWAYDSQFPSKRQYEVIASKEIALGEIFGEYVGKVCYADQQDENSHYCANIFLPKQIANEVPPLVIDSNKFGNEMRFINSVSPTTGKEIQKNVEFLTLWVADRPRIMLCALAPISVGQALILDYGAKFFEAIQ